MSTSAHIVYEKDDGYKSLYVRIDGTIWGLGRHLVDGFKEKEVKHLFSRNQAISSMNDLKKEESNKNWYLRSDKNLDDYYKYLNETDNYVVNDLIIKQLTKIQSKGLVKSFNDDIFNHCNEEFTYLFSNKKWLVAGYGAKEFLDLKTVVNFSKAYLLMRNLQEKIKEVSVKHENFAPVINLGSLLNNKVMNDSDRQSLQTVIDQVTGKADTIEDVLDKHNQTMRKRCYSLMERYNKENTDIQRFVKSMIRNEPSFSMVENLASEQRSIILSEYLSENLKNNKTAITKTKI